MNKDKFNSFITTVKGMMASQLETLSTLAETIENNLNDGLTGLLATTTICGYLETEEGNAPTLSDQEYDSIEAVAQSENNTIVNIVDGKRYALRCVDNVTDIEIYNECAASNTLLFTIDAQTHEVMDEVNVSLLDWDGVNEFDGRPSQLAERVAAGRALPSALASLARFVTSYGSDPSIDVIGGARNLLNQYKSLSGEMINELISVVTGGASALIDYIQNTYLQLSAAMNDDPNVYFANTNIDIQTFSCGNILSTVGTIVSTAGMVLMAISRVVGVIVTVAGGIASTIGQIALKYASGYNDTLFTWSGADQAKCFKFVVAQGNFHCPYLARLMYNHNTTVCSVRSFETGSIIFARMLEPGKNVNSMIALEEHLSIDFDIFSKIQYLTTDQYGPYFALNDVNDNVILTFQNDYETGYTYSGFARLHIQDSGLPDHYSTTDIRELGQRCYNPINLTTMDRLKDGFTSEITVCLYQRLMSSLFLWSYAKFLASIKFNSITSGWKAIYMNYEEVDGVYRTRKPFAVATRFIYLALKNGKTQGDDVPRLTNGDSTNLWQCIIDLFDGIPMSADDVENVVLCDLYDSTEQGSTSIQGDYEQVELQLLTASGIPVLDKMFSFAFCLPQLGPLNIYTATGLSRLSKPDFTEDSFSSSWPTNLGVECPKLTFNAFLTGIIIDGIVIAASIIVTIWAITAALKFKRIARRAQLDAEAATYAYTDAVNSGASVTTLNERFKAYRRANLKANILNFSSGGVLFSSSESSTSTTNNGVLDIKKLIAG